MVHSIWLLYLTIFLYLVMMSKIQCRFCNLKVNGLKAYKLHHSIDHGGQPFTCPCGKYYNSWSAFEAHCKDCGIDRRSNVQVSVNFANHDEVNVHDSVSDGHDNMVCQPESNQDSAGIDNFDLVSFLKEKTDEFVSSLYTKSRIPRQYVQDIVHDVSEYVNGTLISLKSALSSSMNLNNEQTSAMESVFSKFDNLFSVFSSEYKRFQFYKNSGDYIEPVSYEIGEVDVSVPTASGPLLKSRKVYGQAIPIDLVLKKFLELPDCLNAIISYMASLDNKCDDTVENFIECTLWKTKRSKYSVNDVVLPLHIDYDDVEFNNALGSRSLKLGAVYAWIPCLPPECQASVDNIFLALVFETWLRTFSDEVVFKPLITVLKDLEENGIVVNTANGPVKVYFVTGLLLGDNLGLNSVCGFVEGFTANFYCRFCRTHRCVAQTQSVEDLSLLRTEHNFQADLLVGDPTLTGVKKDCVFNALESFHVTSNFSCDVFHDLCEGVCHYVMIHVLKNCIPQYFTLSVLNNRIDLFQHGPCDSNRIPIVSDNFAERDKLKMSGSEMQLFVKMFGLMVGDLVPHSDTYWFLYLKLVELLDVCMSKNCSKSTPASLRILVKEFNDMYVSVTGDTLKAKFHLLVHYSSCFEQAGPLSLMSTKRFESKHRTLLIPAHATESRKNISKTVAISHQLSLSQRFRSKKLLLPQIEFGPTSMVDISDFSSFDFDTDLPECVLTKEFVLSPSWVNIKGSKYKPGMVLLLKVNESGSPIFGVIEMIVLSENNDVIFVYSYLLTIGFDDHVNAYEVEVTDTWSSSSQATLYEPLPLSLRHTVLGLKYVILRNAL